jgi:4-alpha-glucanotransferase
MRRSGILLHITSLPSPYGVGTLGKAAFEFADFLSAARQSVWQVLPTGPTGYCDSPYQSFSTFAGNPYLIDPDLLYEDGLLTREEILAASCEGDVCSVAFGALFLRRETLLRLACARGYARDEAAVAAFVGENADWLPDYALYMAVKEHFDQRPFTEWEDDGIRLRKPEAMARYREELSDAVRFHIYTQYLFSRQWEALRAYCNARGISLLGDIPIYVALDSSDVWANPSLFQLDGDCRPTHVAGVPPDYFSATGQLWGNPLYDWDRMKEDGYAWWMRRIESAVRRFDMLRIDHFRGFADYWRVPYGEDTAVTGEWREGPGRAFIDALKARFPDYPIIAEDLGFLSPAVQDLLDYSGYPGMKVLQFAFDSLGPGPYQPHTYTPHCVCYTGTHDNNTTVGWFREGDPEAVGYAMEYFGLNTQEGLHWGMLRGGMASAAELFIAQMQDYLGLGAHARMNTPSKAFCNWIWRLAPGEASEELARRIARMTAMYERG